MAVDVTVPIDLWDGDEQAVITTWLASDGSTVAEDALIAEIMVEKIQHEIRAPAAGVLTLVKQADEVVSKGDVIARIG
uniref:lipoyl domain-containing protein n=1 Tax=Aminobacter niigataensis TaxID=83265 RepID=UPI002852D0A1|nr:lipoyl domain-containing protein [Aminobacter niigataensis]WMD00166.1 lipoyl domain-containing protein [Aminobacter niigataensis]